MTFLIDTPLSSLAKGRNRDSRPDAHLSAKNGHCQRHPGTKKRPFRAVFPLSSETFYCTGAGAGIAAGGICGAGIASRGIERGELTDNEFTALVRLAMATFCCQIMNISTLTAKTRKTIAPVWNFSWFIGRERDELRLA
jgi:hypothetical protein